MECTIRAAGPQDAEALLELIYALAHYEDLPRSDGEARKRFAQHLAEGRFEALLLEAKGTAVAYAIWFYTYSTFLARPSLYLEDIFVLPEHRKHGFGTAIMRHLAAEARQRGCGRMEWQVLDWNQSAIDFYEGLGARRLREWLPYRLTVEDIEDLAAGEVED